MILLIKDVKRFIQVTCGPSQRFSRGAIAFWKGFERDEPVADYFQGTRTWGTYMINGTKVALPAYDRSLWEMDYVQFASVLLPRVNPGLDITRDIADHAWAATIARAPAFKNARRRQQEAVLAEVSPDLNVLQDCCTANWKTDKK